MLLSITKGSFTLTIRAQTKVHEYAAKGIPSFAIMTTTLFFLTCFLKSAGSIANSKTDAASAEWVTGCVREQKKRQFNGHLWSIEICVKLFCLPAPVTFSEFPDLYISKHGVSASSICFLGRSKQTHHYDDLTAQIFHLLQILDALNKNDNLFLASKSQNTVLFLIYIIEKHRPLPVREPASSKFHICARLGV